MMAGGSNSGFYCEVIVVEEEDGCLIIRDGLVEEGVYLEERVVERKRRRKVRFSFYLKQHLEYKL